MSNSSAPDAIFPSTEDHPLFASVYQRNAVLTVGLSALVSILACSSLLLYVLCIVVLDWWHPYSPHGSMRTEIRFYKTQFGVLFLSLVTSDLVQAWGFGLDLHWVAQGGLPPANAENSVCTAQALMIQWGDVASAFLAVLIAIHTAIILIGKVKPPNTVIAGFLMLTFLTVMILGFVGPLAVEQPHQGRFYGVAGNWCWIQKSYDLWRIYIHYAILFAAAFVNLAIYVSIYVVLRARKRQAPKGQKALRMSIFPTAWMPKSTEADASVQSKNVDAVARKMLLYPAAYIIVILPLSMYRVAGSMGHNWGLTANAICGAIFVASGWVNVLVFTWTRKLIIWPGRHQAPKAVVIEQPRPFRGSRRFTLQSFEDYSPTPTSIRVPVPKVSKLVISDPVLVSHTAFGDLDDDAKYQVLCASRGTTPIDLRLQMDDDDSDEMISPTSDRKVTLANAFKFPSVSNSRRESTASFASVRQGGGYEMRGVGQGRRPHQKAESVSTSLSINMADDIEARRRFLKHPLPPVPYSPGPSGGSG